MTVPTLTDLCNDLAAEQDALDGLVAPLDDDGWATPTPAMGWDIRDSVSHVCYFDESAALAIASPSVFAEHKAALLAGANQQDDTNLGRSTAPSALLRRWRRSRSELLAAAGAADPSVRVQWYGPAMSLASFVTARIMETWAHGQDVVDALGAEPVVSGRLRHVCHIGVAARSYSFMVNGVEDPADPIRVEVEAPGGGIWTWGDQSANDRVTGTALDLALVVTQRRNRADTDLSVRGPVAEQWIAVAQSFAGPAGPGREPGMRRLRQPG